ncbi:hypothetical protein KKB41_00440 [Patescibacteria group bacterium]|nr:hypothetical protein [Patescibacteria group bacterium]
MFVLHKLRGGTARGSYTGHKIRFIYNSFILTKKLKAFKLSNGKIFATIIV